MVKRIDDLEENERFFRIINDPYPYIREYIYEDKWISKPIYQYDIDGKSNLTGYICGVFDRNECVYTTLEEAREVLIEIYKLKASDMANIAEKIKNADWDKEIKE